MIDSHCHLEQDSLYNDLEQVIGRCKEDGLKALITVCANPKDLERSLEIVDKYGNYVFLCASIHPEFVKEITSNQVDGYFDKLKENRKRLVAIGENGLDYFWVNEYDWREKQKELFIQHIQLSKELKLPLVVHTRDAWEDILKILEQEDVKKALLHLWGSKNKEHLNRIIENNYSVSIGPLIERNKDRKRIVRDLPLENIMLETDSPWFGQNDERGIPTNIKIPCQKIAEVKKLSFEAIWNQCGDNSKKFFSLPI